MRGKYRRRWGKKRSLSNTHDGEKRHLEGKGQPNQKTLDLLGSQAEAKNTKQKETENKKIGS